MFAIIETGGKQYRVEEGDTITIEKLDDGMKNGDDVTFDKVLLIDDGDDTEMGDPYLDGKTVKATLEEQGRKEKVEVRKFKAKKRVHKKHGHRQPYMNVSIKSIS